MSGAPRVSIVIPTYNQADLLGEALRSVQAQTFGDWEAIIVNNFSADHTERVVREFDDPRFTLINFANHGVIAASRNLGIRSARGTWVAFLDSDDVWYPDKLARCMSLALDDVAVVAHREDIVRDGRRLGLTPAASPARATWESLLLNGNCLSPSSTLVRRDLLLELGGFDIDPAMVTAEDFDLWLRIALTGRRLAATGEALGLFRLHDASASSAAHRHLAANLEVVRRHGRRLGPGWRRVALRRAEALQIYGAARSLQKSGCRREAVGLLVRSLRLWPVLAKGWAALAIALWR